RRPHALLHLLGRARDAHAAGTRHVGTRGGGGTPHGLGGDDFCRYWYRALVAKPQGLSPIERSAAMQGSFLRFYVHEGQRYQRRVFWEWLLLQGDTLVIHGGSAFRFMARVVPDHTQHASNVFHSARTL